MYLEIIAGRRIRTSLWIWLQDSNEEDIRDDSEFLAYMTVDWQIHLINAGNVERDQVLRNKVTGVFLNTC